MASCASSLYDGLLFEDKINGITVYTKPLAWATNLQRRADLSDTDIHVLAHFLGHLHFQVIL